MKFNLVLNEKNTPEDKLISDVQRVAKLLNKNSVTIQEYNEKGNYSASTLSRRFGSWFKALEKAGLEKTRNLGITEEDYFNNIENVWSKLGRQPKYIEMKMPLSKYSAGAYEKKFGSWNKALYAFISYVQDDTVENNQEVNINTNDLPSELPVKRQTIRTISDRLRFRILMRDGFTCSKCGRSPIKERDVELHVDHIIPWSKGGETLPENLETKCAKCNLGKGNAFNV